MAPYLPDDTTVFLTRTAAPEDDAAQAGDRSSNAMAEAELGGEGGSRIDAAQDLVGRSGTRPWLFAFVGVVSLCLTQMSYYYSRGVHSVYVDYEKGCGECIHAAVTPTPRAEPRFQTGNSVEHATC